MHKDTLKVGIDDLSVTITVDMPDTEEDVVKLSKGNAKYRIAKFVRGYRIDLQEGGARQAIREAVEASGRPAISLAKDPVFMARMQALAEAEVSAFDPDAPRSRGGRPAKPVELTAAEIETVQKSKDAQATFVTLMAAKGVKISITG